MEYDNNHFIIASRAYSLQGGESLTQASGGGGLAMEFSMVAWAWSLGPLLGFAMAQPLNKLGGSQPLDPDLGFLAGFFCRSVVGLLVACLPPLARRGDEELKLLTLWFAWRVVLHLGSREAAPGSVPMAAPCQPLYSEVVGRPLPPSSSATASPVRR
jgi:hypothetical protein